MSRSSNNAYNLTGMTPHTPMSAIYAARDNWLEVVKPTLLDDARRINGPQQRWARQRQIQMIDEAFFDLLTAKPVRHRRKHNHHH